MKYKKEKEVPINTNDKKLSWYLRDTPFFIISFLFVPVSLIILFVKRKQLDKHVLSNRFFIAGLFSVIFILKILPKNRLTITVSILFYVFTGFLLLLKLSTSSQNNPSSS